MYSSRTPRGLSKSLDSNALARCRAYCEACAVVNEVIIIDDGLICNGVRYRTMSGWKHSSIKVILAGVVILIKR